MATEVGQLVLKVDTTGVKSAEAAVERLGDAAQDTTQKTKIMQSQTKKTNVTVGDFGRKAGMAGVQVEQLAGQIAMGQNPLRAFGVQAADLGFVLGVPLLGAVVGIGAALGSVLIPMLMDAEKSTEELEDSLNDIADVMATKAADGADILSERFLKLAKSSRQLAEIELRVKMIDAVQNVAAAQAALIASTEELRVVQQTFRKNLAANPRLLREFSEEMGISQERALELREAIDGMKAGNEGAQESFIELIRSAMETENVTPRFAGLAKEVLQSALNMKTAEEQAEFLRKTLGNLDDALRSSGEEFRSNIAARESDRINQSAVAIAQSLLTEEEAVLASYDRRRQVILDSTYFTEQQKTELIDRLTKERDSKLLEANRSFWDQWLVDSQERMMGFEDVAVGAMQTFESAAGRAFERMIFDSESASDAFKDLAQTMLRSIVNALGQILAQQVAYYAVEKVLGKTAVAGSALAQTSQAAAGVALAGINAFASTAAIPIVGPALAPAAMTAAIAATSPLAAAVAAFNGAAVAGRALGGQVMAGESYVVGERGPEVLTMGSNGRITPNEALGGGGGQTVNRTANVSFSIQANDAQGFDDLLAQRRGTIMQIINEALNDNGQAALV